ncbi:MAG: CDP-diacylglycerol--glycerol-3-phosphate 3-phosphatidyltransferase [Lachnospiraceae bacterium]|nr:CDP-diacylglycerol--glycerol-3-phosphate 3-phosphatidyltransferase [Lachnospiraceae bacterium]
MNLPNKLTLFRVILIPFFVAALLIPGLPGGKWIALVFFCVASVTDFFDGKIARKYNMVTNFGKFMDPLADKLLVGSASICLTALGLLPAWITVILIGREFVISGFRLVAANQNIVIAASWWGKCKTFVQIFMIIALIIHLDNPVWYVIEQILIWASLVLTLMSLIDYIWKNKHVLQTEKT